MPPDPGALIFTPLYRKRSLPGREQVSIAVPIAKSPGPEQLLVHWHCTTELDTGHTAADP